MRPHCIWTPTYSRLAPIGEAKTCSESPSVRLKGAGTCSLPGRKDSTHIKAAGQCLVKSERVWWQAREHVHAVVLFLSASHWRDDEGPFAAEPRSQVGNRRLRKHQHISVRHVPEDVECRGIVWAPYIRHAAHVEPRAQLRVAVARYAMQRKVRAGQDSAQPCNERWQLLEPARGASADEGALVDNDGVEGREE